MKKIKQSFVLSIVTFFVAILALQSCTEEEIEEFTQSYIGIYYGEKYCSAACASKHYTYSIYYKSNNKCYCTNY